MLKTRKKEERGVCTKANSTSFYSFSFDDFYDPNAMGYQSLKVLNEQLLGPAESLEAHVHQEMEIVTYVLEGLLEYQDSMGNAQLMQTGEVQVMSTGTGVEHNEYNLSKTEPVRYLQLWFAPAVHQLPPTCTKKQFTSAAKWGQWSLLVSQNGRDGSLRIHQDVDLYATVLDKGSEIVFDAFMDRYYWIQVLTGEFVVQNTPLRAGDGLAIDNLSTITTSCTTSGELLLIDMAN